jgi:methionyl-tRNA formyltransferase
MALRIVFCGTPEFALPSLRSLLADSHFQIEAVVTQPDRPRGRGQHVAASPVKEFALASGLYVFQPEKIRSESAEAFFKRIAPDAVVIIAYGQIIPQSLIDIPRLGWINLHASLLPKYRGAAPINWAIVNGETKTGITTMKVDAGMDTGPILMQKEIDIGADETAPELSKRMAEAGAPLVVESLVGLANGTIAPRAQDSTQASRAPLLKKENGQIDWNLSAQQIYNRIRGFDPWPGAYTQFGLKKGQIWGRPSEAKNPLDEPVVGMFLENTGNLTIACGGSTLLTIDAVKLEGRSKVSAKDFSHGARLKPGDLLSFGGGAEIAGAKE